MNLEREALSAEVVRGVLSGLRVAVGFDVHPFSTDPHRPLLICGQLFDGPGLDGHSDGDVGAHAISDALLGGCGVGGIGDVFLDTDPRNKGADSVGLLREVVEITLQRGFEILNVDLTIISEIPKIAPARAEMTQRLSRILGAPVVVKAKRPEGLGDLGRQKGAAAIASALLYSSNPTKEL